MTTVEALRQEQSRLKARLKEIKWQIKEINEREMREAGEEHRRRMRRILRGDVQWQSDDEDVEVPPDYETVYKNWRGERIPKPETWVF
jgi:predicted nuclease with TOPRIM domain